jgi:hypothetical protein
LRVNGDGSSAQRDAFSTIAEVRAIVPRRNLQPGLKFIF